ncbi:MAG TPA: hypothetical protein VFN20_15705, partial [Candidatus Acidoferrum sp.]|nr:hypothetical protein [Candidatus Acidoferrum sp.]
MKPARFAVAALILFLPITLLALRTSSRPTAASPSAEEEVRDFERQTNAAYEANDLPKYFS